MFSASNNSFNTDFEPSEFFLSQNYPNPFREKTVIKYCVPLKTKVHIAIYNAESEMIKVLVNEIKNPGTYEVEFSAEACHPCESRDPQKESYYYRLEAGDYKKEKKMQLLK